MSLDDRAIRDILEICANRIHSKHDFISICTENGIENIEVDDDA